MKRVRVEQQKMSYDDIVRQAEEAKNLIDYKIEVNDNISILLGHCETMLAIVGKLAEELKRMKSLGELEK